MGKAVSHAQLVLVRWVPAGWDNHEGERCRLVGISLRGSVPPVLREPDWLCVARGPDKHEATQGTFPPPCGLGCGGFGMGWAWDGVGCGQKTLSEVQI